MITNEKRLKYPNYLLTKYQNEIYRQLVSFMKYKNMSQKDLAKELGVSNAYVSQILNGNFNFTLKKLIELGLMIGKVPSLEFVDFNEYQHKQDQAFESSLITVNIQIGFNNIPIPASHYISSNGSITTTVTRSADSSRVFKKKEVSYCNN